VAPKVLNQRAIAVSASHAASKNPAQLVAKYRKHDLESEIALRDTRVG